MERLLETPRLSRRQVLLVEMSDEDDSLRDFAAAFLSRPDDVCCVVNTVSEAAALLADGLFNLVLAGPWRSHRELHSFVDLVRDLSLGHSIVIAQVDAEEPDLVFEAAHVTGAVILSAPVLKKKAPRPEEQAAPS